MTRLKAELVVQARKERRERERRKRMVWGKGMNKRVKDERRRFVIVERAVGDLEEEDDGKAVRVSIYHF